eukprot:1193553-Prorocentrum_minimum.AAC.5
MQFGGFSEQKRRLDAWVLGAVTFPTFPPVGWSSRSRCGGTRAARTPGPARWGGPPYRARARASRGWQPSPKRTSLARRRTC